MSAKSATAEPHQLEEELHRNFFSTTNPNALHDFHVVKRGPKGVPSSVKVIDDEDKSDILPKDTGHQYANTSHISFNYFDQRKTNAPFGYEHFVSLPPSYNQDPTIQWPLILFLHGSGESKLLPHESFLCLRHAIPKTILCYDRLKSNLPPSISIPFIQRGKKKDSEPGVKVENIDLSEQPVPAEACTMLAENFITVTPNLSIKTGYSWTPSILLALLDEIQTRYRVDQDRIHLSGFSMGGYGTWSLATYASDRFATLMPICGGGDVKLANRIKHIPHWVFHGEEDDVIPIQASEQMVDALHKTGAEDVRFTRVADAGHDSWTVAYGDVEIYRWMLGHRRVRKEV